MKILITGGAGFVGSSLAFAYKRESQSHTVVVVDNLKRRGSEINLPLFRHCGIEFCHGDIRNPNDLEDLGGEFDLFIEGSAEPSVHAGISSSPHYVLQTNLTGTLNCLEFARKRVENFLFLSTSRVYSIAPLRQINLTESDTRFELADAQTLSGLTSRGINEDFPTSLPRSLYGATKLASELIIQEYVDSYGVRAIINRCGVLAGPGQFGKVDQGVFTLWVANHYFERPLKYTGFGGRGKQVRDRKIKIQVGETEQDISKVIVGDSLVPAVGLVNIINRQRLIIRLEVTGSGKHLEAAIFIQYEAMFVPEFGEEGVAICFGR